MLIEVSETHPPRPGKRVAYVHTSTGERYEIWPDKLNQIQVGKKYEVTTKTRQYEGRDIVSIVKVTPAMMETIHHSNGSAVNQLAGSAPQASPFPGEAEYVGRVMAALIAKGDLDKTKIPEATEWLRKVWRTT